MAKQPFSYTLVRDVRHLDMVKSCQTCWQMGTRTEVRFRIVEVKSEAVQNSGGREVKCCFKTALWLG